MTLKSKIKILWIFVDFRLQNTFRERIAPKAIEMDKNKLRTDFLRSRKLAQEGIKEWYPRKSRYFTAVGQSFMKTVANKHGHAAYHNRHAL